MPIAEEELDTRHVLPNGAELRRQDAVCKAQLGAAVAHMLSRHSEFMRPAFHAVGVAATEGTYPVPDRIACSKSPQFK